ncbi:putative transmembrane protein [Toxoplasma gondii VAND]|uniref:Putative transmembrane protein n=1 Tax=Toxoplasma gondii VAND TaxID=933077 RepID=A0A086Q745_TOXGO|nr:putative transmembrane protein [Toxoplasma gondii VAND]
MERPRPTLEVPGAYCGHGQLGCALVHKKGFSSSTSRLRRPFLSVSVSSAHPRFSHLWGSALLFGILVVATGCILAAGQSSARTAFAEEGFVKDSHWARVLQQKWSDPSYLQTVARTIETMEKAEFWITLLGKQVQLQSSKAQLKTQRLERHRLEQRRKKHAIAAYYATTGDKHRADVDLRFGDLSLYALDWIAPRTCADLGWAGGNDVCALSLETDIHVLHSKLMLKSVEVQDFQNRLFSSGGPDVPPLEAVTQRATPPADGINTNVAASLRAKETFDWSSVARDIYMPALAELQAPGATPELFGVELGQFMAALEREERIRSNRGPSDGPAGGKGGQSMHFGSRGRQGVSGTASTTAEGV